MGIDVKKMAEAFGFKQEDISRIRVGPGVVGNTSTVSIIALIAIATCTYWLKQDPHTLLWIIALILVMWAIYIGGTWVFAHLHPDHALMAGSELLALRKLEMAAQHPEIMANTMLTTAAPPPQITGDEAVE